MVSLVRRFLEDKDRERVVIVDEVEGGVLVPNHKIKGRDSGGLQTYTQHRVNPGVVIFNLDPCGCTVRVNP